MSPQRYTVLYVRDRHILIQDSFSSPHRRTQASGKGNLSRTASVHILWLPDRFGPEVSTLVTDRIRALCPPALRSLPVPFPLPSPTLFSVPIPFSIPSPRAPEQPRKPFSPASPKRRTYL